MRALLIIVVVVLGLALLGWLRFSNAPDRSTIQIDKQEIREDLNDASRETREFIDDVGDAFRSYDPNRLDATPPDRTPAPTTALPD